MKERSPHPVWLLAIACSLLVTLPAVGADLATKPMNESSIADGEAVTLAAESVRLIDGKIEVEAWLASETRHGHAKRHALDASSPLTWQIVQGDGRLWEDPGTGRILFEPLGDEPLVVRPQLGELIGEPTTIGMDPSRFEILGYKGSHSEGDTDTQTHNGHEGDTADETFVVAGGGLCGHRMGPRMFAEPVDVRSVVSSTVMPMSPTERVVRYAFGDYYSYHPDVGPMRITYNEDMTSEVRLRSLSPTGEPFFPAVAEGDLYFVIETLDNGWTIANYEPMTIEATVLTWPPFKTPIVNQEGVSFYSTDQPDVEMHRIAYQELYLYPSREIHVETKSFEIENNVLTATFVLRNRTEIGADIRWFLIGDLHEPMVEPRGLVNLGENGQVEVTYQARLNPSALPQQLTIGAVSESGQRLVGFTTESFATSSRDGSKVASENKIALRDGTASKVVPKLVVVADAAK